MARTAECPATPANTILPAPHSVLRVRLEAADTFTLEIDPGDSGAFPFAPGQFNMLYVFGVGEVPISISGDPIGRKPLEHTTRVVGAVTGALRRLKKGETIGIRGPFGNGWPLAEAAGRDVVIVAGGIGLAPLRPALFALLAEREKYRRIVLVHGARSADDILYQRELERWRDEAGLEAYITVDRASAAWRGNVGVVSTLIARTPFDPSSAIALVSGPEVMMRFAMMALQERGVTHDRIHVAMQRNMKCAIGFCGHCQYGPQYICKDGPVFRFDRIDSIFGKAEI